jgi:hypothetical protein
MKRPLLAALCALVLTPTIAAACGMLAEPQLVSNGPAEFAAQTVLVHRRADAVQTHVRLTVAPGAEQFSWILPTPAGATLALGDNALFDALQVFAAPRVFITRDSSGGGGCSDASRGADDGAGIDRVVVGQLGEYDYAIISSGDAAAVAAWLSDNDYQVPSGAAEALQPYADAGLDFIGVKLARITEGGTDRLTPLVISSPDDSTALPVYPLGLSAVSTGRVLPVVVYVIGPRRARVEGVAERTVVDVADALGASAFYTYPDAVDGLTAEQGEALFVTEAVIEDWGDAAPAPLNTLYEEGAILTRLHARLAPEQVTDLRLGWHPEGRALVSPVQNRFIGSTNDGCRAAGGAQGVSVLLMLALLGVLRRRRSSGVNLLG